jgi:hypothetical protein
MYKINTDGWVMVERLSLSVPDVSILVDLINSIIDMQKEMVDTQSKINKEILKLI